MELIKCLNEAIEYIEKNLDSTIEVDEVAKAALLSRYHFQRMFHVLTGYTVGEYIRNRRLTRAGEELSLREIKIIDIAIKYGYESPDAFTKAFQRLHGVTPTMLKKGNVRLKAFPKLSFRVSVTGECEMDYRIVAKEAFQVFGVGFLTSAVDNALMKEIPQFCDRIWEDGTHLKINEFLGYNKMHMLHGIHYDFKEDGSRKYLMGWEVPETKIPKEYTVLEIPAGTWVVFESKGIMPDGLVIQEVWKRIYSEWFPSSGIEQVEGPCMEKYFWVDDNYDKYTCEVWIPIKGKE